MPHVIEVARHGGPDVLEYRRKETPAPGPGQALVRHRAIGLNFIDVYFRTGLYQPPELPFTPGLEAAGEVTAVGEGVTEVAPGNRVAYASRPLGAYAEERVIDADRLVPLPDAIGDDQAAAMMLKGMTAYYLMRRTYRVRPGDRILLHAAAGGVGLMVCQWAAHLGAEVIGTVGSADKAELAHDHGCRHVIRYDREDVVERVKDITGGAGVVAAYDSVGQATFDGSLACLQALGTLVSFGQSSGPVPPLDIARLSQQGSVFLTRPTLFDYIAERDDLVAAARELFKVVESGAVTVEVNQRFALKDAAEAHRALENRETTGSTVLLP